MSIKTSKTLDEVRTEIFTKVDSVQQAGYLPQYLNLNRGIVRGLIELWAWGLYQLYLFFNGIFDQASPYTATGDWLDWHCKHVEVFRKEATKAIGTISFYRSETSGNVPISSGKIVKTKPDGLGNIYRYVTTEDVVLLDGETEVPVAIIAETYGSACNVGLGQIVEITTTIGGVDGVTNEESWLTSEGADVEDDESLRQRYVLAWAGLNGCTKYAYEAWARSVTGVAGVVIRDQHPRGQGTVDVVLRGAAGIPTQGLVDSVDEVVQEKKPINDDALVKGAGPVPIVIAGELEVTGGDPATVTLLAENRLRALFSDGVVEGVTPLEIGQDLTVDMLTFEALAAGNIQNANWVNPTEDIEVPEDGLAVLSSISLTWVEVAS